MSTHNLSETRVWRGQYRGVAYKVHHWGACDYKPAGVWNYYLYLSEEMFQPGDFEPLWLPPETTQFEGCRPRISYDYMDGPLAG